MSDERPRPEYGEYATPEQQARAMGVPYQPAAPIPPSPPDPATRVGAAEPPVEFRSPGASIADRFVTMFFLGIGLLSLLESIPGFLSFNETLNQLDSEFGGGKYALPDLANHIGIGLLVINIVLYGATVAWALRFLSRGRRAFYIPIVGFAIFALAWVIVLLVLWYADPALLAQIKPQLG